MGCKIVNEGKFDFHMGRKYHLYNIKRKVELKDKIERLIYLEHFEYPFVIFKLKTILLVIYKN